MSTKRWAFASGYWIVLLTLLFGVLIAAFKWRNAEMIRIAGDQNVSPLDGRWRGYTPTDAADLFDTLGTDGRVFYAISELSLDILFPFVYGTLLIMLAWRLWRPPWRFIFMAVGVLAVGADLTENGLIAYLAFTFSNSVQPLAHMSNLATLTKWGLLCAAGLGLGVGALLRVFTPRRVYLC